MAQVNIVHFSPIESAIAQEFAEYVRDVVAFEVHGVSGEDADANMMSILTIPVDQMASISSADIELQVLVSGNNWPKDADGNPFEAAAARAHFDTLAGQIHAALTKRFTQTIYVWVTPFTASGWAENR